MKGWRLFFVFLLLAPPASSLDAEQLRLHELNIWSRLESSMLSTQSELDGLRNTISTLRYESQRDLAKQTRELARQTESYNKLSLLLENTERSLSQSLTTFYRIEARNRLLKRILKISATILAVLVAFKIKRTVNYAQMAVKTGRAISVKRILCIWL